MVMYLNMVTQGSGKTLAYLLPMLSKVYKYIHACMHSCCTCTHACMCTCTHMHIQFCIPSSRAFKFNGCMHQQLHAHMHRHSSDVSSMTFFRCIHTMHSMMSFSTRKSLNAYNLMNVCINNYMHICIDILPVFQV